MSSSICVAFLRRRLTTSKPITTVILLYFIWTIALLLKETLIHYFTLFRFIINRQSTTKMIKRGIILCLLAASSVSASVFLPYNAKGASSAYSKTSFTGTHQRSSTNNNDFALRQAHRVRRAYSTNAAAMAIPGYGLTEQIFVGGFMNFLSIYNIIITGRILLSWFPQAQGIGILQPVFQITDPYLNLFRGLIPPIFGLDLSPLLAFFLLNVLTNATAALGAEVTPQMQKKLQAKYSPFNNKNQSKKTLLFAQ